MGKIPSGMPGGMDMFFYVLLNINLFQVYGQAVHISTG